MPTLHASITDGRLQLFRNASHLACATTMSSFVIPTFHNSLLQSFLFNIGDVVVYQARLALWRVREV